MVLERRRAGDFVVKFSASAQMGAPGAARELIASLLAIHMGVLCPRAAIVTVDPDLGSGSVRTGELAAGPGQRPDYG